MNKKDQIIQAHFPTVMVPKYEELEPCGMNRTRLLMARDGLYLDTRQSFGDFRHRLWSAPRPLPYGEVDEIDGFALLLKRAIPIIAEDVLPAASHFAEQGKEWAGWIVADDFEMRYQPLEFEATAANANWKAPELDDARLVIDIHSHGMMRAFFSATDNEDDKGGVKIAIVLGFAQAQTGRLHYEAVYRYAVEGFFIDKGEWV